MTAPVKPPTEGELAEWKAKTDAATGGPWEYKNRTVIQPSGCEALHSCCGRDNHVSFNREFCATAREAMPRLLAEVERLRVKNKQLQEELETSFYE